MQATPGRGSPRALAAALRPTSLAGANCTTLLDDPATAAKDARVAMCSDKARRSSIGSKDRDER